MSLVKHRIVFILYILSTLFITANSDAALYEVGPGKTHADLSSIDWPALQPGDEVRIFWRDEPYRSKIGIRSRGTASSPIRIRGVADSQGRRPVISGENATTPPALKSFFDREYTEFLGAIIIQKGPSDDWGYKPGYIIIDGLRLEGCQKNNRFLAMDETWRHYSSAAAGIWAVVVEHLTVRNCEITDNGNGFFVLSKDSEETVSRDILFEKNYVHGNGVVGSDQEHNSYTQAAGIVFQYNRYGPLRDEAGGVALKDRSADTVIRYNWIESGARTLDLVEPEDSYQVLLSDPGFSDTWVYGNIILNEYSANHAFAVNMIHYGGDIGDTAIYRKGTLHFSYNTVYVKMNRLDDANGDTWNFNFFDLSTPEEKAVLRNNVFYHVGTYSDDEPMIGLGRDSGIFVFEANNWINSGWSEFGADGGDVVTGKVIYNTPPLEGSSPGLRNPENHDFYPTTSSSLVDRAAPLSAADTSSHPVNMAYVLHLQGEKRQQQGNAFDIGALESGGGAVAVGSVAIPPLVELLLMKN